MACTWPAGLVSWGFVAFSFALPGPFATPLRLVLLNYFPHLGPFVTFVFVTQLSIDRIPVTQLIAKRDSNARTQDSHLEQLKF